MPEDMWSYWRDKKGILKAIQEQYPELLRDDPDIAFSFRQARHFLNNLDMLMREKGV